MAAIGILGGTFDPVHNAHLAMARAALAHLRLDKVLFIPTGPTHYRTPASASGEDRVAMLRLALGSEPRFAIDERELRNGATGYSVHTLEALKKELPDAELYLLMGADQYTKLETWHRPDDVKRLATLGVAARPGFRIEDGVKPIPMDLLPVSASEIRERARRGEDIAAFVPVPVANYIARKRLYR